MLHLCKVGNTFPNECPVYDTKQSGGEVPVMLENVEHSFIAIAPKFTLAQSGSTW